MLFLSIKMTSKMCLIKGCQCSIVSNLYVPIYRENKIDRFPPIVCTDGRPSVSRYGIPQERPKHPSRECIFVPVEFVTCIDAEESNTVYIAYYTLKRAYYALAIRATDFTKAHIKACEFLTQLPQNVRSNRKTVLGQRMSACEFLAMFQKCHFAEHDWNYLVSVAGRPRSAFKLLRRISISPPVAMKAKIQRIPVESTTTMTGYRRPIPHRLKITTKRLRPFEKYYVDPRAYEACIVKRYQST